MLAETTACDYLNESQLAEVERLAKESEELLVEPHGNCSILRYAAAGEMTAADLFDELARLAAKALALSAALPWKSKDRLASAMAAATLRRDAR